MARARRWVVRTLCAAAVAYLLLLVAGGVVFGGCAEDRIRDRLARALDADVTIGDVSLSLWRGRAVVEDVTARREQGGAMELTIRSIDAEVAGWGAAILDQDIDRAVVRGVRMKLSARGLVDAARRERQPLAIARMVVEDASVSVEPTALLPGLGRIEATVARAEAADVELSSGLSWLRGLTSLDGRVTGPGLSMAAGYRTGSLTLSGGPLGPLPLTVPLRLPTLDGSARELDHLRALATAVIRAAGARLLGGKAVDTAVDAVKDLLDR